MIKYFFGPVNAGKTAKAMQEVLSHNSNFAYIKADKNENILKKLPVGFKDIIIGNAQFLCDEHILLIKNWSKENFTNIYFIGLVTDGRNVEYLSHQNLLYFADKSIEVEKMCDCGQKATCNLCVNTDNEAVLYTENVNTKAMYKAVCPQCYETLRTDAKHKENATLAKEVFLECYN